MSGFNNDGPDNFEQMITCMWNIEERLKGEYPETGDLIPLE
jgi:hypothetical protein